MFGTLSYWRASCFILSLSALALIQGCAKVPTQTYNPLPSRLEGQVQMAGFPNVRAWGDTFSPTLEKSLNDSIRQEGIASHGKLQPIISGLALSGGGQNGAFGAGLLCGWTASGKRPSFKLVTGISTGALIAPFAFLGPAYDAELKRAYTTLSDKDIYKAHNPLVLFLAFTNIRPLPSLAANTGLEQLIARTIDENILKKIAAEHLKGRRLLVGTTQLNAQRLVIWDMGAIAVKGTPEALALFRKILLASASIPVTFPPQFFKVVAAGKEYDEMHVDGGVQTQVILFESSIRPFSNAANWLDSRQQRNLYVIRNQKVTPEWQYVNPQLKYIATRAISSLTKSQGIADLYRLYAYAHRDSVNYKLAYIPYDFDLKPKSSYDTAYMNALFQRGYEMGRQGYAWNQYPPGFEPARVTDKKIVASQ